jgi:hypothetical protein
MTTPLSRSADSFQTHEKARLRAAARHARRVYPGELGELLFRELTAYAEFGIRFSVDALLPRLATRILTMTAVQDDMDVTSISGRRARPVPDPAAAVAS